MPIQTIENHTIAQLYSQLRCLQDCIDRVIDNVCKERWDKGDLSYVLEQFDKAGKYLFAGRAVCEAQRLSLEGFTTVEVRAEV